MISVNRQFLFDAMNVCVKKGRMYQRSDPPRAVEELEKLAHFHSILNSVTNFESKLLSELDIDD